MNESSKKYTDSGIEIKENYTSSDLRENPPLGGRVAGTFPFTRGIQPDIYIPTNYDALVKGVDYKMKVVMDLIKKQRIGN